MIDAACGEALIDKPPEEAKPLISNIVKNSQQFGLRIGELNRSTR